MVSKYFHFQANQFMSERISGVEGTKLDDDFHRWGRPTKSSWKIYSFFCTNIFSSATPITLNSEWCIWILQHGKEDGSLQWVGGWLADQDKRVPSGANIFLSFKVLKKCCCSLFVGVILSHWIIFSPILRSERRWQQLRWFSVLATFQNFFTLDRNNVCCHFISPFIKYQLIAELLGFWYVFFWAFFIDFPTQHSPFKIVSI